MATITSGTSGAWGTGANWVGGIAPVEGDKVNIARTSTALESFSTDATGYAIGSTAITLTGAVAAGSYVIGESVQFGSDPNYYRITNWVSGTKVLTVTALIIAIPASATLVKAKGHAMEIDGTYICGDDTSTALNISGTIYASRTVNSSLTVKGDIQMAAGIAATIDYGRRSLSDRIPSSISATLILNYSAAMVNYKYGIFIADSSNAYFCGATRTRNTVTTSSLSASGTSVDVADITGWAVNDWVIIAETDGTNNHHDRKQIATITPTTGTAGTITFSAVTYAHASGAPIGNFSSNVTIKSFNTTNPAYFCCRITTTTSNLRRELDYTTFEYVGSDVSLPSTKCFGSSSLTSEGNPFLTFDSCSFYQGNASIGLFLNSINTTKVFSNHAFFTDVGSPGAWMYTAAGTYVQWEDCVVYFSTGVAVTSAYSQGGQGATYRRCKFWTGPNSNTAIQITNGSGLKFIDCQWHCSPSAAGFVWVGSGDTTFTTCKFGTSDLPGTKTFYYVADAGTTYGQVGTFRFNDCSFGTPTTSFYKNLDKPNLAYIAYVSNKNLDPLSQEIYTPNGTIVRDNTTKFSGVPTCVKMSPTSASNALTFTRDIYAPDGVLVTVSGLINRDTANTATVTLTGLGITTSTYTASAAVNTDETYVVSGTNNTGTDGVLTLTFSVTGTSGNMYVGKHTAPISAVVNQGNDVYWALGVPSAPVIANQLSAGDVWSYQASQVTTAGSMGKKVKSIFVNTL